MNTRVCPWYIGYLLANPLRRLVQDPEIIVLPHVREGMKVLEIGPGMGFFTIPLAKRVGESGKVFCIEVQQKMLNELRKRASRAHVEGRIDSRLTDGNSLGIGDLAGVIDFALLFAVVHEVPDQEKLFAEISDAMRPGGHIMVAEPKGHVKPEGFERMLDRTGRVGLAAVETLSVRRSYARLLEKQAL